MNKLIIIIVLFVFYRASYSQYDDFGVWSSVKIDYDISNKLNLNYSFAYRTEENSRLTKKIFNELGANYEVYKYIRLGFEYRNTFRRDIDNSFDNEHRIAPFLRFDYKLKKDIRFDFRTQYQFETRTYTGGRSQNLRDFGVWYDEGFFYERQVLRLKPRIKYDINKKSRVNFSYEMFILLSRDFTQIRRERYSLEYEKKINKRNSFDIAFLYQYQLNITQPRTDNVIKFGYNYTIK